MYAITKHFLKIKKSDRYDDESERWILDIWNVIIKLGRSFQWRMENVKLVLHWNKGLIMFLRRKWEECGLWFRWMWFSSCLFIPSNPAANVLMNSWLDDTCSAVIHHQSEENDQRTWNYKIGYKRKVGRVL